ncbi:MAG: ADP-ribose pyrophosphatase [Ignavibacteriae bacterium]|nr:MAG: ADP-ribose pyrophosphatase [Ignavibacteriota bacterium]
MNFKIKETKTIFNGKVFDIKIDEIEYDSGNEGVREIVVHNGGAVVLPVTDKGKVVFVKQYRYPFDEFMYELPAGKLEKAEDPLVCATRELTEETGYTSDKVSYLGKIYTTPGFCTEILYLYLAENLVAGEHDREEGEYGMEVYEFTLKEIDDMINTGKIVDGKSLSALYFYKNKKEDN